MFYLNQEIISEVVENLGGFSGILGLGAGVVIVAAVVIAVVIYTKKQK